MRLHNNYEIEELNNYGVLYNKILLLVTSYIVLTCEANSFVMEHLHLMAVFEKIVTFLHGYICIFFFSVLLIHLQIFLMSDPPN